jgi:hypothetical protein
MKTFSYSWHYLAWFFLKWENFQIKVVEKIKIHILCSVMFVRKMCHLWHNIEKVWSQRPQMAIWHMRFACRMSKATCAQTHSRPLHPSPPPPIHRNMLYILVFHGSSGFVNAPQCYVIRTFPLFIFLMTARRSLVRYPRFLQRYVSNGFWPK